MKWSNRPLVWLYCSILNNAFGVFSLALSFEFFRDGVKITTQSERFGGFIHSWPTRGFWNAKTGYANRGAVSDLIVWRVCFCHGNLGYV